jgi:hypothetical protein
MTFDRTSLASRWPYGHAVILLPRPAPEPVISSLRRAAPSGNGVVPIKDGETT